MARSTKLLLWSAGLVALWLVVAAPYLDCQAMRDRGFFGSCYGPVVTVPGHDTRAYRLTFPLGLGYVWWWPHRYITVATPWRHWTISRAARDGRG